MYKHILRNIQNTIQKKEDLIADLWKNSDKKHSIHDQLPHVILSAENPRFPAKLQMSHTEALDFLKKKGYNAEAMKGKYGTEESSILIHNPSQNSLKHLGNFAEALGQESLIYSNSHNHEMHYVNGPKKGRHNKGEGTVFHKKQPTNDYSTLNDGTMFSHGFDMENTHPSKDSNFIKDTAGAMKKSESYIRNGEFNLRKAEDGPQHKLALAGAGTKLIHYSPHEGLETIDPNKQGSNVDRRRETPEHKMAFYYAEGVSPESLVTTGSKSKYVVDLGDKKLYDIHKDPQELHAKAMKNLQQDADKNQRTVMPYEKTPAFHKEIKQAGFHGIFNSGLDKTMSHAIGLFIAMKPEAEHKIHERDFEETSAKDQHLEDREKAKTKQYAESVGHPDHEFLHNLKTKLGN